MDSSSSGTWCYPLSASITVKNPIPAGMVRTAWNGVAVSKLGRIMHSFSFRKSIASRMSPFFLGTTTIGWIHAVGFMTLRIMPAPSKFSNSVLSCGNSGTETGRDPRMATGEAPSTNLNRQGDPTIGRHWPSKMSGNSPIRFSKSLLRCSAGIKSLGFTHVCGYPGWSMRRSIWDFFDNTGYLSYHVNGGVCGRWHLAADVPGDGGLEASQGYDCAANRCAGLHTWS